ncbi:magnesium chelatase accessory protein [Rhodoligotrophos appendicifer]|uniref:alpha/beta fold hydrolase BchO n=1 Tax=Rhodoligotrophos appendicifer TaxID=987056 RepID=UPI001185DA54|nr:alpha/beta fold hydrolase BchO [Rhodoligotrophos appendicifer]
MARGHDSPSWAIEGRHWPNREHSRFVTSGGLSWHVQEWGEGPDLLLVHGTGAATHSFRSLQPALATQFRSLALDLPGHGFTEMPDPARLSLPGMARAVGELVRTLAFTPAIAVGHSAGAAILVQMTLEGLIRPKAIIALNGALRPMRRAALFSPLAKLLFLNPVMPRLFAWRATSGDATRRLLEGTGSRLDDRGVDLYASLFQRAGHVAATLGMMAHWDLESLEQSIGALRVPLILVTAANDRAIPPFDAKFLARRFKTVRVIAIDHGGHLLHEERPQLIADMIGEQAQEAGVH